VFPPVGASFPSLDRDTTVTPLAPPYILTEQTHAAAIAKLSAADADLAAVVARWGAPPFWTHEPGFAGLVLAILSQQVSLESAKAAFNKLAAWISPVEPAGFLTLDDATLRAIGFSRQKAGYVRGLATVIISESLDLEGLVTMGDDQVREALLAVKGIGRWTADTYLLFVLRRSDAWPSGDLALAKAIQEVKGLPSVPSYPEVDEIAESWHPWRAVAARILWHAYLSVRGR
jgi:DNA-3-methyladenine glycosylase II